MLTKFATETYLDFSQPENQEKMASAIVGAVNNFDNPSELAKISKGLGKAMEGIDIRSLTEKEVLQARGW